MSKPKLSYKIELCDTSVVANLCKRYHPYGSSGKVSTYSFCVKEYGRVVAVYGWQPPPIGCSKSVCPEAPQGVLALSRMAAVPRDERDLNHVSKPLRRQMKYLIDRTRWPVLVTFSDNGLGHSGHVYKCSGWTKTTTSRRRISVAPDGSRESCYKNGVSFSFMCNGTTTLQRWEHRICPKGEALRYMKQHGWFREPIPGKYWASGNQAHRWVNYTNTR